jgi:thymidylate synthase
VRDWDQEYVLALRSVLGYGRDVEGRGGATKELTGVIIEACPPGWLRVEGRGGSPAFARGEQLYYLAGLEPRKLSVVAPRYDELCRWQHHYPDAYGPRMFRQLRHVVIELDRHPTSRRAVVSIHDQTDTTNLSRHPDRPVPCTLNLQFLVRDGELEVLAMMRSCDAWLGLYYDLPAFAFLGRAVGVALGVNLRRVWLHVGSLHLYARDWDKATLVKPRHDLVVNPLSHLDLPMSPGDPAATWNGLVEWARDEVERWEQEVKS